MKGKCGDLVRKEYLQVNGVLQGFWYCEFHGIVEPKAKYIPMYLEDFGVLEKATHVF